MREEFNCDQSSATNNNHHLISHHAQSIRESMTVICLMFQKLVWTLVTVDFREIALDMNGNNVKRNYNSDLIECIQGLRRKREAIHQEIASEEREKGDIQEKMAELKEQFQRLNGSIGRKAQLRDEYDKTIKETEIAYMKVKHSPTFTSSSSSSISYCIVIRYWIHHRHCCKF